ncbi:hypothetical protein D3C87_228110 [compost metagenome]
MEIRILICLVGVFSLFSCEETENTVHITNIQVDCYNVDSILNKRIYASVSRRTEVQDTSLVMIDFKLNAVPVSKGINIMSPIRGVDGKTDSILDIRVLDSKGQDIRKLFQSTNDSSFCINGYKRNRYQNGIKEHKEYAFPIVPFKEVNDIMKLYNNSRRFKLNDTLMINNSFVFLMRDSLFERLRPITFSLLMLGKKSNRLYKINSRLDR